MHTNHRRKNVFRPKHHGVRFYQAHQMYSRQWMRRMVWQTRRARERDLMSHERYDKLPCRYPRNISWWYW